MSAPHGCTDDKDVVEKFTEALKQRIGAERFRMWFANGVTIEFVAGEPACDSGPQVADDSAFGDQANSDQNAGAADTSSEAISSGGESSQPASSGRGQVAVRVRGQFALDRLKKNFTRELRAAAMQACGSSMDLVLELAQPVRAAQCELPLDSAEFAVTGTDASASISSGGQVATATASTKAAKSTRSAIQRRSRKRNTSAIGGLLAASRTAQHEKRRQMVLPNIDGTTTGDVNTGNAQANANAANDPSVNVGAHGGSAQVKATAQNGSNANAGSDAKETKDARGAMNVSTFIQGACNELAYTAMKMVSQTPGLASPLFLAGPTGIGKTHMLHAIADQFRRRHRMRRVVVLSAEQFTNDFVKSVSNSGLPAFRRRYREVDALLIDGIQFLGAKRATLRELHYTVESLADAGRPLVFTGNQSPVDIPGLTRELAGRLSAGLICPMQPLDQVTRGTLLRRLIEQRCSIEWPEKMIDEIAMVLSGDGRVISGLVNLVSTLQLMHQRMPTMSEIRAYGGDMLRSAQPTVNLSTITQAICEVFQVQQETLTSASQVRSVCEPRALAMYLSRQLTSAAYAEIAGHFGVKSHSTAMGANRNVKKWIEKGKMIGRGPAALSVQEAIDRVETILRTG